MGVGEWLSHNWFDLFSSAGIIGGLWFTAVSLRSETKTRRIANLLTVTANSRRMGCIVAAIGATPARIKIAKDHLFSAVFLNVVKCPAIGRSGFAGHCPVHV
jgi:hypothetical protein